MTGDLRAAILVRCDELERLARAAAGWLLDDDGEWSRDGGCVLRERLTFIDVAGEVPSFGPRWTTSVRGQSVAPLVAAFGPAAVLDLVAGAREMVVIHAEYEGVNGDGDDWTGCECGDADESVYGTCPTLRATARMIGVEVTG